MRINKYISQAGVCSRRKADEMVLNGKVKVNGKVMKEPGYDVEENDVVEVNGRIIEGVEKPVYYMLNKPTGFVTTVSDEKERPTVLDLIDCGGKRLFPVGRLDYNTSGLLIITNDGDLTYHISHPKHEVYKTYQALVAGQVTKEELWTLRKGVDIGNYITKPAQVTPIKESRNSTVLEISICEGHNHQVRDMCSSIGHPVQTLHRISVGDINLGHLKLGAYRKLNPSEIKYLKEL